MFKIGNEIEHKKIGKGKIIGIKNNTITIDFLNKGEKDFSLSTCIEKNLLKPIKKFKIEN